MKPMLFALLLMTVTTMACAAGPVRQSYRGPQLADATVAVLVERFSDTTGHPRPADLSEVLVLVNGVKFNGTLDDADLQLLVADAVEVLVNRGRLTVNIVVH